jgi:hypothetical protein
LIVATPLVAERAWCVVIPHHPIGAGEARSRLSAELAATVRPEIVADAVSIIAELVGNSIRVAWKVWSSEQDEVIEVRVTDGGGPSVPEIRPYDPDAIDGRGLTIVAALARSWGYERDGLGQTVWAELTLPQQAAAA